jgi:hypothetical protein
VNITPNTTNANSGWNVIYRMNLRKSKLAMRQVREEGGEEEKKRQKRGGKGMIKTKKKEDGPKQVCVSRAPRGKKKSVTVVTGLSSFGNIALWCV